MHAKLAAERELSEKTMVALDDHNRQLRETRAALQASEADVEILKAKLSRQQDTGKRARRSRQNRDAFAKRGERVCRDACACTTV